METGVGWCYGDSDGSMKEDENRRKIILLEYCGVENQGEWAMKDKDE